LARSAAEAARAPTARSLQTRVKAMLKDYQAATQAARELTASEQHIEDVSKQITDHAVGHAPGRHWISTPAPSGTGRAGHEPSRTR